MAETGVLKPIVGLSGLTQEIFVFELYSLLCVHICKYTFRGFMWQVMLEDGIEAAKSWNFHFFCLTKWMNRMALPLALIKASHRSLAHWLDYINQCLSSSSINASLCTTSKYLASLAFTWNILFEINWNSYEIVNHFNLFVAKVTDPISTNMFLLFLDIFTIKLNIAELYHYYAIKFENS